MGDVIYIGVKRKRDNDVVVVEIKSGRVLVDNMDKYYSTYHLWKRRPGTVEYLERQTKYGEKV